MLSHVLGDSSMHRRVLADVSRKGLNIVFMYSFNAGLCTNLFYFDALLKKLFTLMLYLKKTLLL